MLLPGYQHKKCSDPIFRDKSLIKTSSQFLDFFVFIVSESHVGLWFLFIHRIQVFLDNVNETLIKRYLLPLNANIRSYI